MSGWKPSKEKSGGAYSGYVVPGAESQSAAWNNWNSHNTTAQGSQSWGGQQWTAEETARWEAQQRAQAANPGSAGAWGNVGESTTQWTASGSWSAHSPSQYHGASNGGGGDAGWARQAGKSGEDDDVRARVQAIIGNRESGNNGNSGV